MGWMDRFKPWSGDVYRPGECLPEPQHQTATGRKLYTVQQIRAAYSQGAKDSRTLLTRCRNMLSHPAHWGAEESVVAARYKLYTEVHPPLVSVDIYTIFDSAPRGQIPLARSPPPVVFPSAYATLADGAAIDGVIDMHDLHVWTITSGQPVMSAHIVVSDETLASGSAQVLDALHEPVPHAGAPPGQASTG